MELLAIREEKIPMLWILLSRNASTNTKSFYHNSWEMKFILSTQGASQAPFFFSPLNVRECVFWTEELCSILFLPICTSRIYSVHVNQPAPHPTPSSPHPLPRSASEMVRPTTRVKNAVRMRAFSASGANLHVPPPTEIIRDKLHTQKISLEFHEHKVY